jgi:ribosomal-protein-alanine N-acetyltransferase
MDPYIISTPRLGLRKWRASDFLPFALMNSDHEVMQYFPDILNQEETHQLIKRIHQHFEQHGFGLYALEQLSNRAFIGYTGFMIPRFESFFTPCVEIGWRIKRDEWNKGYATEAAKVCL